MKSNHSDYSVGFCEHHHKLWYTDRSRARRIANRHPEHKGVFRCEFNETLWHIGRIPEPVRRGVMTKAEFYGRADGYIGGDPGSAA